MGVCGDQDEDPGSWPPVAMAARLRAGLSAPLLIRNSIQDTGPRGTLMDENEDHRPGPGARSAMGWALRKRRSARAEEKAHRQGRNGCSGPVTSYRRVIATNQPEMAGACSACSRSRYECADGLGFGRSWLAGVDPSSISGPRTAVGDINQRCN